MNALFDSGRVIDLILGLMVVEAIALALYHARTGRGIAPRRLYANLLAGACLMLALRASLTGAGVPHVASWLLLGLVAHLADLGTRWPRISRRT